MRGSSDGRESTWKTEADFLLCDSSARMGSAEDAIQSKHDSIWGIAALAASLRIDPTVKEL